MKAFLAFFVLLLSSQSLLLAQCNNRYQSRYFNSIQIHRDVVYSQDAPALIAASITTETTFNKDLVMDIFMPPVTDTVTDRPVVILAHGGGFINVAFMGGTVLVGTMDNDDVQALADTLAHWGFVTASIEYRLGFNVLSQSSIKRAVWRGAQDYSAAVRFFRKNAAWFGVDPNRVLAGGSSAGAFCAIHSAFVDYPERMAESFQLVPILKKDLGAMHSRPIVELTSFNPFNGNPVLGDDVDSLPAGIAAYWGAIAELDWITQGNNKVPMIMFHGTADPVVSYKCNPPFASVILTAPVTCGTYMMDSVMTAHNMPHEAYYAAGESHEYWGVLNGNWLPSGPNAYWPDIIQKTANFYYKLMQPAPPIVNGPTAVAPGVNYTYSVANPNPNHSYCWNITGGVIVSPITTGPTVDVQFFNQTTQGLVEARIVDQADIMSEPESESVTVAPGTNVNAIPTPVLNVNLHPNPAENQVMLTLESSLEEAARMRLYNTLGQEMLQEDIPMHIGKNRHKIDLTNLPRGTYFVEVSSSQLRRIKTLVLK